MKGRSWGKIMLIGIVCILSVPLLKEAVAQEGRTLEERLATLEAKVTELEERLSRLVGRGKASQMILTGDHIKAEEALRIGLVDEVYAPEELMPKAKEMALKIASKGPLAIKAAKEAIKLGLDVDLKSGCEHEASLFAGICASEDKIEGTKAFLEKRKAEFKGR